VCAQRAFVGIDQPYWLGLGWRTWPLAPVPARRTRYFARNELSRLCMDALTAADGAPLTTDDIAGRIIEAKGFDAADAALRTRTGDLLESGSA
jgi:hypothetical protein